MPPNTLRSSLDDVCSSIAELRSYIKTSATSSHRETWRQDWQAARAKVLDLRARLSTKNASRRPKAIRCSGGRSPSVPNRPATQPEPVVTKPTPVAVEEPTSTEESSSKDSGGQLWLDDEYDTLPSSPHWDDSDVCYTNPDYQPDQEFSDLSLIHI